MRGSLGAIVAGLALATGALAVAGSQDRPSDTQSADEVSSSMEIICRREPPPTGSRIGARNVCKTEMEWARIEREARDALEDAGNRNRMGNEGAGTGCGIMNRGC